MKIFFAAAGVVCLWMTLLAQDASQKQESKTPFMVSLTDLKWVELPERKGMQFAILSGDPKRSLYADAQISAGTDNGLHSHSSEIKNVIISGVWYTGPMRARPRFWSRLGCGHAGRLDAREWLPYGNRLRLLSRG